MLIKSLIFKTKFIKLTSAKNKETKVRKQVSFQVKKILIVSVNNLNRN